MIHKGGNRIVIYRGFYYNDTYKGSTGMDNLPFGKDEGPFDPPLAADLFCKYFIIKGAGCTTVRPLNPVYRDGDAPENTSLHSAPS